MRFREVNEEIKTGDFCKTIDFTYVPAVHCVGRKVRPENYSYVLTNEPHTPESLKALQERRAAFAKEIF